MSRRGDGRPRTVDVARTLIDGPWRHRYVAANGHRFHAVEAGQGPLVLLLHGFPQFWWAWRHQLPALADAGYRAVAMDLRGYGASDKPPRGYDTTTLAGDVAGVVRALGEQRAVVVGHDMGAWLAWSLPTLAPDQVRAVAALSMGHPLTMRRALLTSPAQRKAWRPVLRFQLPSRPEWHLTAEDMVGDLMTAWAARGVGSPFPDDDALARYRDAIRVPFVAHSSMEYYRWLIRSLPRRDGRSFAASVEAPPTVPVLHLHGELDPFVLRRTAEASHARAGDGLTYHLVPQAGHFLPEEAPDVVSKALLGWLDEVA